MASSSSSSSSSTTPFVSSSTSSINDLQQHSWLNNSTQIFTNHLQLNTSLPVCIFHLPETLTSQKPSSYTPNHIGLGPIHHFRTNLYTKQEQLKLTATKTTLQPYNITPQFLKTLHQKLIHLVPLIRCCYDLYFDVNDECLAWVFVLDSLFLLDLLSQVAKGCVLETLDDVIMLENQIPRVVMDQLLNTLQQYSTTHFVSPSPHVQTLSASENYRPGKKFNDSFLENLLIKFSESQSPLKFTILETELDPDVDLSDTYYHLLAYMYQLIINHTYPPKGHANSHPASLLLTVHLEDVVNAIQMAGDSDGSKIFGQGVPKTGSEPLWSKLVSKLHIDTSASASVSVAVDRAKELIPRANAYLQRVSPLLSLPWGKILTFIKNTLGENPTMLETEIPSVSRLSIIGKIEFRSTPGGIHDITFDEKKPSISLPVLDLKPSSEVVLRNLVAYEEMMFKNKTIKNLDFTEYVDLMCGIIDGVRDVKILREKKIIEGDMSDEDVVKLFNGMNKSSLRADEGKSKLVKTIEEVNVYYGDLPRVLVFKFIKKVFLASWKILAIVLAVLSMLLTVVTGVCQVYDCKASVGLGNVGLALGYADF
ncbi:hypothetical protein QVD17_27587 [Tagetes erecta]|uniref:Uncharacterized protein n=1 Tax=Tagetes erecta TaxID=13708 RepID=A0AAD8NRI7_TARER|nr:hypothetical protein QVD17_27587 [Tagetes erecta]